MDDTNVDNVTEAGASSISASSKKSKFTSNVWEFFERVQVNEHGNMVPKVKCVVCNSLLRGGATAGTSHLRRHLQIHEKGQKRLGPDISGNITTFAYNKNVARRELVDYVARRELVVSGNITTSSATSNDLQMYYDLPTIEVDDDNQFSVLAWWKSNEPLYPIVSRMARDLLTIPASTVASESCFSAGGRIVSEKRACLSPSTIEALICLKDWSLAKSRMQEAQREMQLAEERRLIREARPDWMENSEDEAGNGSDNDSGNESSGQVPRSVESHELSTNLPP